MHFALIIAVMATTLIQRAVTQSKLSSGDSLTCGGNPVDLYAILADFDYATSIFPTISCGGAVAPSISLKGLSGNITSADGVTQFYVCDNDGNLNAQRCFALTSDKRNDLDTAWNFCNGNSFFITETDNFSFGVDTFGQAECLGGIVPPA